MRRFLQGLAKFVALVLVAGGVGVALGMGLSQLSGSDEPASAGLEATTRAGAGDAPTEAAPAISTATAAELPPATTTAPTASTAPAAPTTATPPPPAGSPLAQVRVNVLDARLFTDSTPSGGREQRARVTVRIRAQNAGTQRVALNPPRLRVGSVRVPSDPRDDTPGTQFDPLPAGASQTVTLRFELEGEATPKVVRDRRARILIAGQSLPMRIKVRAPTR